MNCAAFQSRSEALDAGVFPSKHNVANRGLVRHYADDHPAVEQVGDLGCGGETERSKLVRLIRATHIGNDPISGRGEVCGHRRPHVAEADKADFAMRGEAA